MKNVALAFSASTSRINSTTLPLDQVLLKQANNLSKLNIIPEQPVLDKQVVVQPSVARQEVATEELDHLICRNGEYYAGSHLIADFYGAQCLTDIKVMETAFSSAIAKAGATLLHMHFHHFTPSMGISGVAVLAESHISVHTWPERSYAAFDIFMCGDAKPELALEVLTQYFTPSRVVVNEHLRGKMEDKLSVTSEA